MYFKKFLTLLIFFAITITASDALTDESQTSISHNAPLHLGQDAGVESIGLQIRLGETDDLIYPSLLWHYRMGVRHFEILHQGLTPSQHKKIQMFYDRVKDICSLNAITLPEGAEFTSTLPSSLKWILYLTDRQILCLHKPLAEILSEHSASTLIFPSCIYQGFDPDAPVSFWPQTDERLIYRSNITFEKPVRFQNQTASSEEMSTAAHIAAFATMEDAVPFTADMVKDQLPFDAIIRKSIYQACLRGKGYWDDTNVIPPILNTAQEIAISYFYDRYGALHNARFGSNYVYLVNEKCGYNTITRALGSYEADRMMPYPEPRGFHRPPYEIANRYQYLTSQDFYKFSCVRNPFVRALSSYLDKIMTVKKIWTRDQQGKVVEEPEVWPREGLGFTMTQKISFKQFLEKLREKSIKEIDNHFKPMWAVIMYPVVNYNKIVHLETFDRDFQEVMDYLGIPGKPKDYLSAEHATKAVKKLSEYYTPECVALVLEIYKDDFKYFDYSETPHFTVASNMDIVCLL